MSIFNPLTWFGGQSDNRRQLATFEEKSSAVGPQISAHYVGQPVWTDHNYADLARESYRLNPVAFRCVKKIATAAASVKWLLHDKAGNEITDHPLLDLLARPNPNVSGVAFSEAVYAYLLLSGNSYIEGVGPDNRPPMELWNLRPDRMLVVPGPYGTPGGFEYTVNGTPKTFVVDPITGKGPVLQIKEFDPLNDWYGMSRVLPAARAVDRNNAAAEHNTALLQNGARPSGVMSFPPVSVGGADGELNAPPSVIEAAEKRLNKTHMGPKNAGKPMVVGGTVKWDAMGLSPVDMDFDKSKDDSARDICIAWGVPHVLIVKGASTFNNISEAKLELYEDTVIPSIDLVAAELNNWLTPQYGDGLKLSPDLDSVSALEPRRESKRKSTLELFDKGLLDSTEAREALQYGPRDPSSVLDVDASTITALVNAAKVSGLEPLARYMVSVGLVPAGTSAEALLTAANGLLEDDGEDGDEEYPEALDADGNPITDPTDKTDPQEQVDEDET